MSGPASSPVSDPQPYQEPEPPKAMVTPKTDWQKLGDSRKFPQVNAHIEARKEYFRHFLPGGEAMRDLAANGDYETAGKWGALASTIVDELDTLQFMIQRSNKK